MAIKNKGRKTYRSMKGKVVDLDLLIKRNELTPAVGNARVNARGDELGPGGKIVRKREEIVQDYYKGSEPVEHEQKVAATPTTQEAKELAEFDEEAVPPKVQPKRAQPKPAKIVEVEEDEWIEDPETGDFIRKGD